MRSVKPRNFINLIVTRSPPICFCFWPFPWNGRHVISRTHLGPNPLLSSTDTRPSTTVQSPGIRSRDGLRPKEVQVGPILIESGTRKRTPQYSITDKTHAWKNFPFHDGFMFHEHNDIPRTLELSKELTSVSPEEKHLRNSPTLSSDFSPNKKRGRYGSHPTDVQKSRTG